jgi:hypothetical protein
LPETVRCSTFVPLGTGISSRSKTWLRGIRSMFSISMRETGRPASRHSISFGRNVWASTVTRCSIRTASGSAWSGSVRR